MNDRLRIQIRDSYNYIMESIDKSLCKHDINFLDDFREGLFITTGSPSNVVQRLSAIRAVNPKLKIYIVTQSKNIPYYREKIEDVQIIAWDKPYNTELKDDIGKIISLDKSVIAYFSGICVDLRNTNIVKLMSEIGNENTVSCVIDELTDIYIYNDIEQYIRLLELYDSFEKLLDCCKDKELI